MNINEYRAEFAAYNTSLQLAHYQYHVGSELRFKVEELHDSYGDLFSFDALEKLKALIAEAGMASETEATGLQQLLSAARLEHIEIKAGYASRELAHCESSVQLKWNGQAVSPKAVSVLLATEPNKVRRDELSERWSDAVATCDDLRLTRLRHLHNGAISLGFVSYRTLIADATNTNLQRAQAAAEALLEQTEGVHRSAVTRIIMREFADVPANDLRFADLAYLERLPWLDKFFSAQNLLRTYSETIEGMGISVDKQPNIQIAFGTRSPGACSAACFPVNPPLDVRLLSSPGRHAHEFAGFLHAAGKAQQHAWSSKSLAQNHPEFIYSPNSATNEGYGYLFSLMLLDAKWLQEFLQPISGSQAGELVRDMAAILAVRVRRLCAETSYAMLLHSDARPSSEQLQSAFVELHDRATLFHFDRGMFLLHLHERMKSVVHLRALAFAVGLREYLRVRHGHRWWGSRKAGDELIDLWNTASRYSVEELARLVGFGEISFDLIAELLIATTTERKK